MIAAEHGLGSLTGDVAAMKSASGRVKSPALPVAYSNGGTLITAAGTDPRNASLRDRTQLCSDAFEARFSPRFDPSGRAGDSRGPTGEKKIRDMLCRLISTRIV
jgi:hypothetical protein